MVISIKYLSLSVTYELVMVMTITNTNYLLLFFPADVSVTSDPSSPTLILTITGVVVAVVFFLVVLVVCVVICCLHMRTKNMETTMNFDESSIESPSLRKKADCTEEDAKASNANNSNNMASLSSGPSMLGGQNLKEYELEEEEKDNWHELLPREGRAGEGGLGTGVRFLKRSLSRDSSRL